MRKVICLFLLVISQLYAEKETRLAAESEPLLTIADCVNLVDGSFYQVNQDFVVEGPMPLTYTRHYDSGDHNPDFLSYNHNGYGVSLGYPLTLKYTKFKTGERFLDIDQRQRFEIPFVYSTKANKAFIDKYIFNAGYTNCTSALERGQPSLAHTEAFLQKGATDSDDIWEVRDSDDTKRIYTYFKYNRGDRFLDEFRYLLLREDHPNGLSTHYTYDQGCLVGISLKNSADQEELSTISIAFNNQESSYVVSGSDGRSVKYQQMQLSKENGAVTPFLTSISAEHQPKVDYEYVLKKGKAVRPLLKKISTADGSFLGIEYNNITRVEGLWAPLMGNGNAQRLYTFEYKKKKTRVLDALKRESFYYFDDHNRLTSKNEAGLRETCFTWNKQGQLKCKYIKKGENISEVVFFRYDAKGNISQKLECGHITGGDLDAYPLSYNFRLGDPNVRAYHYNHGSNNLLLEQQDPNGLVTYFAYTPGTNLLACKRLSLNGAIFSRELYSYDKNAILIERIEDDGFECNPGDLTDLTYRVITRIQPQMDKSLWGFTKPKVKEKLYLDLETGQEKLLKRTEMEYVRGGMLGNKRVYDCNGDFAYEETYHYNDRLLLEEKCDRLGRFTRYGYDEANNLIFEELVGSGKQTHKSYDSCNRLVETKEIHDDGTILIASCTYDLVGNCTSVTDAEGFTTQYFYDGLNRKIKEIDPYGHESHVLYDAKNNPIKIIDKEGHLTLAKYNIDHHPLVITYPDDTREIFRYHTDGKLRKKQEKDGTSVNYTYDYLKRPLTEMRDDFFGNILTTKSYLYKGANLIAETDAEGMTTQYTYDNAKRLIAKTKGDVTETYGYDCLSRLCTITRGGKVIQKVFDSLNRVVEERIEDLAGNVYRKTTFNYDIHGNVCQQHTHAGNKFIETSTLYNSCNLPILQMDGMGNQTTISYNHCPFQKVTVDPLGQTTIETYNALKKVILTEIPGLMKQEVVYSPKGHKIKQIDHIYQQGVDKGLSTISWEYDCMGNLVSILEQGIKKTAHTYLFGRLNTTKKADDVILYHSYDGLGKLKEQSSSDGTICTQYTYDLNGNMLCAYDKVNDRSVQRTYDAHNNIISETTHTTLHYAYDELNRLLEIRLPDSTISYSYNPTDLVSITRQGKSHTYEYDLAGRLLQENTFDGTTTFYDYDNNDRLTSIISPYYIQTFFYDAADNITSTTINDQTTTYVYDGLYQLIAENTTSYVYDSLYNRLSKDNTPYQHNKLHQVLSDNENIYTYDSNGNRLTKNGNTYIYDALNRLTSAGEIAYSYDALGRLQSRLSPTSQEFYLYYKEIELGTLDNLKILGKGIAGIEQNSQIYSVIRDHRGSPSVIMCDTYPVATYIYTAFGETTHTGTFHCPWQYSGHRCDADTQMLHAPKRIYDPQIGRWLTPDPLGFADGPNLYAYVHNNPLIFIDSTGLFGEMSGFFNRSFSFGRTEPKITFYDDWEKGRNKSSRQDLSGEGYQSLANGRIIFIGGIMTPLNQHMGHLRHIGDLSGGFNIHGVHNATNGFFRDVQEYFLNPNYIATPPVRLLHEEWNDAFACLGKKAIIQTQCQSQGSVLVRNALMSYPVDLRKRIIVVAIAPSCYIDESLCKQVNHYTTDGDFVGWLDPYGRATCRKNITVLKSTTMTGIMDHGFQSPTFADVIRRDSRKYINEHGF